jgi:hypothetical protein
MSPVCPLGSTAPRWVGQSEPAGPISLTAVLSIALRVPLIAGERADNSRLKAVLSDAQVLQCGLRGPMKRVASHAIRAPDCRFTDDGHIRLL